MSRFRPTRLATPSTRENIEHHSSHRLHEIIDEVRRSETMTDAAKETVIHRIEEVLQDRDGRAASWDDPVEAGTMGDRLVMSIGKCMTDRHVKTGGRDVEESESFALPGLPPRIGGSSGSPGWSRMASHGDDSSIPRFGDIVVAASNPPMVVGPDGVDVSPRDSAGARSRGEGSRIGSRRESMGNDGMGRDVMGREAQVGLGERLLGAVGHSGKDLREVAELMRDRLFKPWHPRPGRIRGGLLQLRDLERGRAEAARMRSGWWPSPKVLREYEGVSGRKDLPGVHRARERLVASLRSQGALEEYAASRFPGIENPNLRMLAAKRRLLERYPERAGQMFGIGGLRGSADLDATAATQWDFSEMIEKMRQPRASSVGGMVREASAGIPGALVERLGEDGVRELEVALSSGDRDGAVLALMLRGRMGRLEAEAVVRGLRGRDHRGGHDLGIPGRKEDVGRPSARGMRFRRIEVPEGAGWVCEGCGGVGGIACDGEWGSGVLWSGVHPWLVGGGGRVSWGDGSVGGCGG